MISYFIVPIVQKLKEEYEIHLFHIDSINDCKEPREFQWIIKHDIGKKSPQEIMGLFDEIQPQCVILINIYSLFELLVLRLAKCQGYKTILLQHGVLEANAAKKRYDKLFQDTAKEIRKLSQFCLKYISFIINSKKSFDECKIFYSAFIKRDFRQTKFDAAIFFTPYWAKQVKAKLWMEHSQLEYCGYPLTITNREYSELLGWKSEKTDKAILIHQPFIKDNLTAFNYEDEREYMKGLLKQLSSKVLGMDILLHPREDFRLYEQLYGNTGIGILQNIEKKEYSKYRIAIGFYSTALFVPISLHIPVWIVDYDKILAKDSIFYPISIKMEENISHVPDWLIENFISDKIGTDNCSSENIATKIVDCINRFNRH